MTAWKLVEMEDRELLYSVHFPGDDLPIVRGGGRNRLR